MRNTILVSCFILFLGYFFPVDIPVSVYGTISRPLSIVEYQNTFVPNNDSISISRMDTDLSGYTSAWMKSNFYYVDVFPLKTREKRQVNPDNISDLFHTDILRHQLDFVQTTINISQKNWLSQWRGDTFEICSVKEEKMGILLDANTVAGKNFSSFTHQYKPLLLVIEAKGRVYEKNYPEETQKDVDTLLEEIQPLLKGSLHAVVVYGMPYSASYTFGRNLVMFVGGNIGDATGIYVPHVAINPLRAKLL